MYKKTDRSDNRVTINTLAKLKQQGEKFTCLTAYDASFAILLDNAGVDVVLVGDSLGMVIQGHDTTVPVTMEHMIYHASCVASNLEHALLMVDMPFMSYANIGQALKNAARLMQEGGAQLVKLEGGRTQLDIVRALADRGVPVCAHLGLQPQSVHKMGGYHVQGRTRNAAQTMIKDASLLEEAGADILLLECVPDLLAQEITSNVTIPVIGIGAGGNTDAQVLVLQDILGITPGRPPKFSKNFMAGKGSIREAIDAYIQAVKNGQFPAEEHIFS